MIPGRRAHGSPQVRIGDKAADRVGEAATVWGDKSGDVRLDLPRHRPPGAGRHRQSGGHGLQQCHPHSLVYARPDEYIGTFVY